MFPCQSTIDNKETRQQNMTFTKAKFNKPKTIPKTSTNHWMFLQLSPGRTKTN